MLKVKKHGPITVLKMGRSFGSKVVYWVNSFRLDDLLVDGGTIFAGAELEIALENDAPRRLILTHHHEDHTGNCAMLQKQFGVESFILPAGLPFLDDPQAMKLRAYQRHIWGYPLPSSGAALGDVVESENFKLQVIETRGHSIDHACFFEPQQGWLFTGDIYCGGLIKYFRADEDYRTILEALQRLAGLDFSTVFCGLKGVVENGKAALQRKIDFMENLKGEVLQLHESGWPQKKIAHKLMGREGAMFYITGGHYAKSGAVRSIVEGYTNR
jgi:endoribonuclease LACTB2